MKHILCFLALLLLAGLTPAVAGVAGPDPHISVTVSGPQSADICGTQLVTVTFTNTGIESFNIPTISADLDNYQDGLIRFVELVSSPGFLVVGSAGTSNPNFRYPGIIYGGQSVTLTMRIEYSCDFFDISNLDDYFVQVIGQAQTIFGAPPEVDPFDKSSDTYSIGTAEISPAFNLPVIQTPYNTPFSISVPLEITGDYCDDDFTVILSDLPACFDFSSALVGLIYQDVLYDIQAAPAPNPVDGAIVIDVELKNTNLPNLCEANYPNGMGELTLLISDVIVPCNTCQTGAFYPITVGFTPCNNQDAPEDCKINGHVQARESTTQQVYLEHEKAGQLTLTNTSSGTFSMCSNDNTYTVLIKNESELPVYYTTLQFANQLGYTIASITLNGEDYPGTFGSEALLDFSLNTNPAYGFEDLNGDTYFNELPKDGEITAQIIFEAPTNNHCGLGQSDACPTNCQEDLIDVDAVSAVATWNNSCNSGTALSAGVGQHLTAKPFYSTLNADGSKLAYNVWRTVEMELTDAEITGFNGYMDQGDAIGYICIQSNLDPNFIAFNNLLLNGNPVQVQFNNGYAVLGALDLSNLNPMALSFDFSINACPANQTEIELSISFGVFFENCPDCFITLACNDANFLSPCSGGGGGNCDIFSSLDLQVYNSIYTGPTAPPLKAYPCDEMVMEFSGIVAHDVPGADLLVGFLVSTDFVSYFENESDYKVEVFDLNGGSYELTLTGPMSQSLAPEPYSVVYYTASSTNGIFSPLNTIVGHITIPMTDAFLSLYDKIDYFTPVLGAMQGSNLEFCYSGFYDFYALDVSYELEEELTVTCADGGEYTAVLIKKGGEINGPDFPGVPRVVAQFDKLIKLTLPNGYQALNTGNCTQLGNPYNLHAASLVPPTGYEIHNQPLQTFSLHFEENCDGSLPIEVEHTVVRLPTNGCGPATTSTSNLSGAAGNLPSIQTGFDLSFGDKIWLTDNTYTLQTITNNTGGAATDAWIQLEYDPTMLEVEIPVVDCPAGITVDPPVSSADGTTEALIIPIGDCADADEIIRNIKITMLEASCGNEVELRLYGFHRCHCSPMGSYAVADEYTDQFICLDSERSIRLEPLDADLIMTTNTCHLPQEACDRVKLAVIIENPGQGNLNQVYLKVEPPSGLNLLSASYDPVYNSTTVCDDGPIPVDQGKLLGPGWLIDGETLYGIQSGLPEADRIGRLYLEFRGCDINFDDDEIKITAWGTKPCGEQIEVSQTVGDIYALHPGLNAALTIQQPVALSYDCQTLSGSLQLTPIFSNWSSFAKGKITLTSPTPGLAIFPNVIEVDNPASPIPLIVIYGATCDMVINVLVETCYEAICYPDPTVCSICRTTDQFTINFVPPATGTLSFQNFCMALPPGVYPSAIATVQALSGTNLPSTLDYNQAIFTCDENQNGIADPGEAVLYTAGPGTLMLWGGNTYRAIIPVDDPSGFWGMCDNSYVIVSFSGVHKGEVCVCLNTATGFFCCNCAFSGEGGSRSPHNTNDHETLPAGSPDALKMAVSPNPSTGLFRLAIESATADDAQLTVYNSQGKQVYTSRFVLEAGMQNRSLDLSTLPAGLYYLQVSAAGSSAQQRLLKQ